MRGVEELGHGGEDLGARLGRVDGPVLARDDELVPALEEEDPDAVDLRLNNGREGVAEQPGREVLLDRVLEVLGDVVRQVTHRGTQTTTLL